MKRFSLLAAAAAALTLSSVAVSADRLSAVADCKKVDKNVTRVCGNYNAYKGALEALRDQMHEDELAIKAVRTHTKAVEGVFKAIRAKKSKKAVKGLIAEAAKTNKPLMKEVKPLAKKYPNYRLLLQGITITEDRFEAANSAWLSGDTSPVGKVKCKKVKKNAFKVCTSFKGHKKDLNKIRKQLVEDKLAAHIVDAHIDALDDVFKAVKADKSVKVVDAHVKSLKLSGKGVKDQLAPLVKQHKNYKELVEELEKSGKRLDKALTAWKKSKTSDDSDDVDDVDDIDDADDSDDTSDSDDVDDVDDADDADDFDDL